MWGPFVLFSKKINFFVQYRHILLSLLEKEIRSTLTGSNKFIESIAYLAALIIGKNGIFYCRHWHVSTDIKKKYLDNNFFNIKKLKKQGFTQM